MRKNLSLLIRVLSLALIVSLVFSCRKQNVKQVNIDNQFAISIFSDTIKIGDLLNNMDSTVSEFIKVKEDGSIGPSDGLSRNFDIARKNMGGTNSDSYNNYYGLLSYTTNEIDPAVIYNLDDTFKGSIGYSIMFRSTSNTKYNYFTNFVDGNSYESSKAGQQYDRGLNDNMFAAVEHSFITNDNEDLHSLLRNSDGSINVGNMLKVINYTAGILGANNYLLFDDVSGECALVDCSDVVSIEDIFNQN